ncbi:hypothetical protein BsWGS_17308 [Bradybaena similaris]
MPIKCCVPLCRSNYDDETVYTTVFKFPSETRRPEMRRKWIQCIHRKDWTPSKRSVVCIKHFQKEDVITYDKFTDTKGIEHTLQRHFPALKPDAYPTIFSRLPTSLETKSAAPHKNPSPNINKPAFDKCCVPGCRSNYRGKSHTPVFRFPSRPNLKKKWLELIGRRNYVVNKDSVVCAKHFQPHFLITVNHVKQDDGTILIVPRTTPKLQSGALPTVFPHASPSSSAKLSRKRKAFEDDIKDDATETGGVEINQQNCLIKDSTASFHSLCKENDSHIYQQMSKSNLAVEDTSRCAQMVRGGQLRTRNAAKHRPGFTEVCQNSDKKVELLSLVCCEHSSTVTTDIKVEIPSPLEHNQTSLELPDSASGGELVSAVSDTSDTSQSLAPGQARGTVTTDIKVENPSHILRNLLTEHRQTSLELPDSASGGESVSTVSGTSDTSQSLTPDQATGTYYCPQCSIELPDRSKLYKHFINTHISGSSKKSHASTDICAEYNDKSVSKGGCHEGVADDRDNEGNQKQTHSCTAKLSHKPDVCSTGCVNVGQLQTPKFEQTCGTSARRISVLTEVSSQKLIQENNNMLTVDKLHSENGKSNETLQERISANEINSEVCVRNKCHIVCGKKTFHVRTVKKTYKCEFCDSQFRKPSLLKTHTSKHTGVKPFHCDVCGVGFAFKCFMDVHMRKHTGEKPYVCEYCGVRFVNRRQLKLHTTSHTGEKPYKCDVCMLGFNHAFSLQAHTVQHTGVKPFHCDVCGVGFTVKKTMNIHMRKHTGEKPYACEDCGARFVNRRQLKVHRISHTGEKPYKCCICEAGFNQAFNLQLHKRKHTGEEPYKYGKRYKQYVCQICGLHFSSNSAVQHHKRRHTGEKPHQCDVCGVAFTVKTSLINHQRKHTGEKPYSCDVCGLRFSVIESLQNHLRKHTGEKPHLCDICGTKFAHSGSLRDHKRLHTGEKPYKCCLCGADFSNHKKLQRHRKIHAEETYYTSDVTEVDFSGSVDLLV